MCFYRTKVLPYDMIYLYIYIVGKYFSPIKAHKQISECTLPSQSIAYQSIPVVIFAHRILQNHTQTLIHMCVCVCGFFVFFLLVYD